MKESFCGQLERILSGIPNGDKIVLLGDFNARIRRDNRVWNGVLGKEGVGNVNSNGILLLTKCAEHNLVIMNTLFQQKDKFKVS